MRNELVSDERAAGDGGVRIGVQGFRGSGVLGFRGSEVQGFWGLAVPGFWGSGV